LKRGLAVSEYFCRSAFYQSASFAALKKQAPAALASQRERQLESNDFFEKLKFDYAYY